MATVLWRAPGHLLRRERPGGEFGIMSLVAAAPVGSLYIHVPFCAHKCEYCAFFSEPAEGAIVNRYVGALVRELELVASDLSPQTVYFGGGTPSLLSLRQWERLLRGLERLRLLGAEEWTIECNPATVSLDKARLWRDHGVNRLSLGVQSLDEALLDRLGRIHSREMVFQSFDLLRRSGFDNLNLDLMFAIPGQTRAAWQATLDEAVALESEHLSCYEVTYEEDTPLFEQLQANRFSTDEDLACAMYDDLVDRATAHGFHQYEVANFARDKRPTAPDGPTADRQDFSPAFACRHNVNYWRGGFYYGLGPSASSYVRDVRTKNWSNTLRYCEELERGQRAIESRDELSPLQRAGEIAAFGLRMVAGWPFERFRQITGFELREAWKAEMEQLAGQGLGVTETDRFRLTPRGLRFADTAAALFLK